MAFQTRIHHFPVLPSTMDEARRLAADVRAPEGTLVVADTQTAGRGRFGNQWASPEGNLLMTLVLRPEADVRVCAQISFLVAVALSDILAACGVPKDAIALKWPNDVLIDGAKIAGILLEMQTGAKAAPDFLLVGVGVNIKAAPEGCAKISTFDDSRDAAYVRDALVSNIAALFDHWSCDGFSHIRARWLEQAYGIGGAITARMADRQMQGVFEGIDAEGNLLLRENGGNLRIINSADVHFAPRKG